MWSVNQGPLNLGFIVEEMVGPAKLGSEKYALFIHLHQFHFLSQNLDFTYLSLGYNLGTLGRGLLDKATCKIW